MRTRIAEVPHGTAMWPLEHNCFGWQAFLLGSPRLQGDCVLRDTRKNLCHFTSLSLRSQAVAKAHSRSSGWKIDHNPDGGVLSLYKHPESRNSVVTIFEKRIDLTKSFYNCRKYLEENIDYL